MDTLFRECDEHHLLRCLVRVRPSVIGGKRPGETVRLAQTSPSNANTRQNRMAESLVLFDSVVNSRWFMRTSIILFLNKVDLFRQKLGKSPLSKYFPDYSGGDDVNRAAKYLLWRFNQVNRAHLNLYPQ